jgi:transcriptional regulator with XRE-family HTH domain
MALASFDELLNSVPREQQELIEKELAIAVRIESVLVEQGLTKRALARKAGMKEAQLSRILSGNTNLTLKTIVKLECALGVSLAVIPPYTAPTKMTPTSAARPYSRRVMKPSLTEAH